MQTIALPKKVKYQESKEKFQGKIIIEPCFPGYGITLGNSLRRVLLSSLPGAAPIGVKIKGVDHEFSAFPHLKEDVLEFILSLKQLRLKIFTDEPVKLELNVSGKKQITAADITKNSSVEIINEDLVLGHLTDEAGSLEVEIHAQKGMGFEMSETREVIEKEIGYMEMDSVYTPVVSVGLNVENVRVGKMTNWDKLILDIKTDGTITPEEAFDQTVKILIDQFSALAPDTVPAKEEKSPEVEEEVEEEKKDVAKAGEQEAEEAKE